MFDTLSEKFAGAFKHLTGKAKISESNIDEALKDVKTALLEADVNFKVVKGFIDAVKQKAIGQKVIAGVNPQEQFIKIVHDELCEVMGKANEEVDLNRADLLPIIVVGLNGQGKTTFSGKMANYLAQKKKKEVLLVPADTYRPAAKKQLETLAAQIGVDIFDSDLSMTPAQIAKAGFEKARELKKSVVIIDTAGRLHVDNSLMKELVDVKKALASYNPELLMVADAMTGQEAVSVTKTFHEAVGLTGVVLSKMDSDARGGAALSIRYVTGLPIKYISTGEKMKDFELFHPDRLAGRILDMGDVVSLVEKAQEEIDENEAQNMMKNLEKGRFTVNDFMKQMNMMSKLGSMGSLMKMIPGMGEISRQVGDLSAADSEMKRMKVIIGSMTKSERDNYKLIKDSRLNRIAKGAGLQSKDVHEFLAKFKQMEKMMSQMSSLMGMMKSGKMPQMPAGMGMPPQKGFRQQPGLNQFPMGGERAPKEGKKKGPWGGGFFS